jgi:hypothetical protein
LREEFRSREKGIARRTRRARRHGRSGGVGVGHFLGGISEGSAGSFTSIDS